jgi:peptidoglycan hydrolase-like protein with peptidoglycan-binding domain
MRALRKGHKGDDVKWLQTSLNSLGYNCGLVDGSFGNITDSQVRKFQRDYNLVVDGWVGAITQAKINELLQLKDGINSKVETIYYKTTTMTKVKPEDILIVLENKKFLDTTSKNIINGTFFWKGNPNGILVSKGKILCGYSSHAYRGYPQSAIYFDGKNVGVKRITLASELGTVEWAIGGVGMITPYGYSPTKEGFNGAYADVLRQTNKTAIGYKDGYIYLIVVPNISHGDLLTLLKEYGFEIVVSCDGGGSSCERSKGKIIMKSDGRTINNWVVVKE